MTLAAATLERTFCQSDFDRFAILSGDNNPIHIDPGFAARTRFGRTVAHGLLLCSVLRALVDELMPGGVLLEQSVMFAAPTYANEPMQFSVETVDNDDDARQLSLDVRHVESGEITCRGFCRVAT